MRFAILLVGGIVASGCSASSDRPPKAETAVVAQPSTPRAPSAARGPHPSDSACAGIRALTERSLPVTLAVDTAGTFDAPRELGRWTGCRYTAAFGMSSDSVPSNMLHGALAANGWQPADAWGADGADGTEFGFVRQPALCHVAIMSPAGDEHAHDDVPPLDSAPGAREISWQLEIRCTAPVPRLPAS